MVGSLLQYSNWGRPEVWLGAILFISSAAFCTWSMAISKLPAVGWSATLHVILQQLLTGSCMFCHVRAVSSSCYCSDTRSEVGGLYSNLNSLNSRNKLTRPATEKNTCDATTTMCAALPARVRVVLSSRAAVLSAVHEVVVTHKIDHLSTAACSSGEQYQSNTHIAISCDLCLAHSVLRTCHLSCKPSYANHATRSNACIPDLVDYTYLASYFFQVLPLSIFVSSCRRDWPLAWHQNQQQQPWQTVWRSWLSG